MAFNVGDTLISNETDPVATDPVAHEPEEPLLAPDAEPELVAPLEEEPDPALPLLPAPDEAPPSLLVAMNVFAEQPVSADSASETRRTKDKSRIA